MTTAGSATLPGPPPADGGGDALLITAQLTRPRFRLEVALTVPPGVTVLLGPSGAGKSTTLDLIAGHVRAQTGRIRSAGGVLFDDRLGIDVPPHRRRVGYVMQAPALFPHLDVAGNLGYGLFAAPAKARAARVRELAAQLGIVPLLHARVSDLSGGERQRVALGRALAPRPDLLLLDEPLSAVDAPGRRALLALLGELIARQGIPVLYVTHNDEEATLLRGRLVRYVPEAEAAGIVVRVSATAA